MFYIVSDDLKSAEEYILIEQNKKFNIAWPYKGAVKDGANTWPRKNILSFIIYTLIQIAIMINDSLF